MKGLQTERRESLQTSPALTEPAPMSVGMVARLWVAMISVWGHKFSSHNGELPVDDFGELTVGALFWAKGLAGFGESTIMAGIQKAMMDGNTWPPNLPEMRLLCMGVPSLADVRHDLKADSGTRKPFTRLVWQFIDGYQHRNASTDAAGRMVRDAYELARDHVIRGGALPSVAAGELTQDGPAPLEVAAPEVVCAHMAEARELLGRAPQPSPPRPMAEKIDIAAVEADLRKNYADHRDRKTAAAGGDA